MNLCQWFSNSAELNNYIANIQQTPVEDRLQKLLGLPWDTETDELIFNLPKAKSELLTKRRMLQLIASCYDPIGILTPVSLIGKLFFQSIAKKEHAWDTSLNAEQHLEVKKILQNWSGEEWRIPRKLFSGNSLMESNQLELHVFTDSSKAAYGTVAYLRSVSGSHSEAQFLMSKSRVVPIKTNYSIPQLEALAILTGVRLANYCLKECHLKINKTYLWSDSMCSLDSLQKTSTSGSRFVRNRVKQIQEQGENFEFSHVPGKINPADLLTRGVSFEELKKSTLWIQGPDFLHSSDPLPLRSCSLESAIAPTTHLVIADQKPTLDVDYFSSFHRLLRMVMIMIQFITSGKSSTKQRIARSKTLIFRLAQRNNPPSDQTIASLQLQKDNNDDLWMFFGRAIQRPLIFLPHGHVTKLLILHQHEKNNHSSPMFTLSKLRESYWIPNGLSHVKRIIRQCKKCPRFKCRPYEHPPFAAFPGQRILPSKPFQHTGIDYAGPLRVLVNNVVQKVWFILFTCLYSRFVTTEIVMDMTTSNFLHALRRLSAQFGTPETIICDNAQQFHLLHDVIQVVKNQMTNSVTIDSITLPDFRFITPHSPWEGGIYERMIGLIKESLVRAGSTKRMFGLEELRTTLAECTNVVNCRPLTYISSDDDIFPLRPIDFIRPHHHSTGSLLAPTSNLDFSDQIPSRRNLIEEWEQLSTITEEFRRRWNREYIQVLQERKECQHKQVNPQKILPKIGDVVLIHQPTTNAATWPLGKIEEVKERSAIVKNGKTKRSVEYPWKLLFPLETSNLDTFEAKKDSSSAPSTTETAANDSTGQQNEPTRTLRRSTRKITPTNFFTGLAILSLVAVTSAEEASSTIPSTTNSLSREEKESTWFYVPSWTMIFFAIFLFCGLQGFITATLCINCICTWILFIVSKLSQLFHQCFSCIWKICRRRTSESTILIVLFFLVQGITSCNEIASLQATDAVCAQSKEGQHCLINKVVTLNLRADAQMGCFNIKEANNKSEETIVKIKALSISSTCNERTHHFTREFTINHEYTHRCAGVGSCVGNTCENLNEQDSVPEISQMAMDGPGFSSCYGACGCITCDWCVSCSPSCIFSRLYWGYQRRNQNRRFQNNPQQTHVATAVEDSTDTTEVVTHTVVSVVNNEEKQTSQTTMETIAEVDESKDNSPDHSTVIMMTADLPIMDKDGNEHIGTVFFDTGSNISYITKNFSDKLQLTPTGQKKLNVSTFASKESRSLLSNVFNVSIKNKKITTNVNLCEVPHIASNIITATVDKNILEQLLLDEPAEIHRQQKEVDILIGVESQLQILGQVSTIRLSNGLQLNLTDAGPILSGQESKIPPINNCTFTAINNQADEDQLCQQLNKFWSLETIGILDNNPTARADEEVNDFFRQTTTRDPGGRFIVRLPYKQKQKIPSNRTLALGQLQSIVRRLKQDSEPTQEVHLAIDRMTGRYCAIKEMNRLSDSPFFIKLLEVFTNKKKESVTGYLICHNRWPHENRRVCLRQKAVRDGKKLYDKVGSRFYMTPERLTTGVSDSS
ncbi:hypothetical protein CAEBREN_32514 [Caenorhabditis brenneri]|uniref:Integrase catalytic domain-containing protein n=1 Tax=Caenorhabditis brenneri TaxID=135651 RepID=G0PE67_CAEBE|nr:hypothetical protein CAEBREN_32514 [Caenorhabditis brenneri]